MVFIERELVPEPAVQAVIGTGSIANGLARPDSDIDAIIFLDPFDRYIVPAEFKQTINLTNGRRAVIAQGKCPLIAQGKCPFEPVVWAANH